MPAISGAPTRDEIQHDLLLVISTALFILLATGLAGPPRVEVPPTFP